MLRPVFCSSAMTWNKICMKKKRNITVVTGIRSEYGIWRPVLERIAASRALNLSVVVTGVHLLKNFGHTAQQVHDDGWPMVIEVPMYRGAEPIAESLSRATVGMARAFDQLKTDVVMVLGDRFEIFAAASAALTQQRVIAHVHGGEVAPAQFDEQIRHAVTKMAHLHFCSTRLSRQRIIQMGENPKYVFATGAPALDAAEACWQAQHHDIAIEPGAVVILHAQSPDEQQEYRRARMLLAALGKAGLNQLDVLGPNNDPGYRGILRAYEDAGVKVTMSVPPSLYWGMLMRRGVLVGNSSSGIIEAATFGCRVLNVGDRQKGRERSPNVVDVSWSPSAIAAGLRKMLWDKAYQGVVARRKNVYGTGHAAEKMIPVLESADLAQAKQKLFRTLVNLGKA